MPRILLALAALLLVLPASAHAKLTVRKVPKVQNCGPIKLGIFATKKHKGSRQMRVVIRDSEGDVRYRKRIKAYKGRPREWQKTLPCKRSYEVTYRFPKGSELVYNVRVRSKTSSEVDPVATPPPTPGEEDDEDGDEEPEVPDDPRPNVPSPTPTPVSPQPTPTATPSPSPTPTPTPSPEPEGDFSISSAGETQFLVMNWWRGDPEVEGPNRLPGSCTGPPPGNCFLGARKTFRPQQFVLGSNALHPFPVLWLDVPQYEGAANTFDHYPLPVELVKTGCTFRVRHIRTHGSLEFPLNPPGLEILPHTFTMPDALCSSYDPGSPAWIAALNAELDDYLGADPFAYTPEAYPYNDPRSGKDPSE